MQITLLQPQRELCSHTHTHTHARTRANLCVFIKCLEEHEENNVLSLYVEISEYHTC